MNIGTIPRSITGGKLGKFWDKTCIYKGSFAVQTPSLLLIIWALIYLALKNGKQVQTETKYKTPTFIAKFET